MTPGGLQTRRGENSAPDGEPGSRASLQAPHHDVVFIPGVGHLDYYCGASESVYQIVRHMKRPPLVVTSGPHGLTERLSREGLPVRVLPFDGTCLHGFRRGGIRKKLCVSSACLVYALRLSLLLRRVGARVVYSTNHAAPLVPIPARLAGARVVIGIRGSNGKVGRWARALRWSDRVVLLSREMRENFLASLPARTTAMLEPRTVVIYNGLDLARCQPSPEDVEAARRSLDAAERDAVVLYVAAFRDWKGQLRFIEDVIPRLPPCLPSGGRLRYAFLGSSTEASDRDYERRCREAAASSKAAAAIHFLGFREDPWSWYAACDVVVLASEHEGMPRAVIEAMASGKPVVSYDVCSAHELLDGGAGIVVPRGDAEAMAAALNELAARPDLARSTGAKGAEFARKHLRIEAVAEAYEKLFEEVLRGTRPPRRPPQIGRREER